MMIKNTFVLFLHIQFVYTSFNLVRQFDGIKWTRNLRVLWGQRFWSCGWFCNLDVRNSLLDSLLWGYRNIFLSHNNGNPQLAHAHTQTPHRQSCFCARPRHVVGQASRRWARWSEPYVPIAWFRIHLGKFHQLKFAVSLISKFSTRILVPGMPWCD